MKLLNLITFAIKCVYVFVASFALTELIFWHFFEAKVGHVQAIHILCLAGTLHALRAGSIILQRIFDLGIAWKPYVSIVWLVALVVAQLFVLGLEGIYTSNQQFHLVCGWIVANAVSLAVSIYLCEHASTAKSCDSGTCH